MDEKAVHDKTPEEKTVPYENPSSNPATIGAPDTSDGFGAPRTLNKKLAATALAVSLAAGGAGAALFGPTLASAADSGSSSSATARPAAPDPTAWIATTLKPLVDAGTITQAQADAVAQALAKAGPPGGGDGPGRGGHGPGPGLAAAATAIGIDETALRTALQSGSTIAAVATEHGVDVQKVIDALVADTQRHLASDVSAGRLTQAQADQRAADAAQHASDLVNRAMPTPPNGAPPGSAAPGSSTPA